MNGFKPKMPRTPRPRLGKANLPKTKNPFHYLSGSIVANRKRREKRQQLHG